MLGFSLTSIVLLFFVSAVIGLLTKGIRKDTIDYDMEYLWEKFDIGLEEIRFYKDR